MMFNHHYILGKVFVWKENGSFKASFRMTHGSMAEVPINEKTDQQINERINMWVDKGYDVIVGKPFIDVSYGK